MITIYSATGQELLTTIVDDRSTRKRVLMGDNYVLLNFKTVEYVNFSIGSYVIFEGQKFYILTKQHPQINGWCEYSLTFEAIDGWLKKYMMFFRTELSESYDVVFSLTTDLFSFVQLVVKNINREIAGSMWVVGDIDETVGNNAVTLSFSGETLFAALSMIAKAFSTEWYVTTEIIDGVEKYKINVKKCESSDDTVEFIEGDIISSMDKQGGDDSEYGTRFYIFGGTQNIPDGYGDNQPSSGLNNIYATPRLRLPNGQQYIDAIPGLSEAERIDKLVFLDNIFPKSNDVISSSSAHPTDNNLWRITISGKTPQIDLVAADGEAIKCVFQSGSLMGMKFDMIIPNDNYGVIYLKKQDLSDTDGSITIPNESLKPNIGDEVIFTGIVLTDSDMASAEQELLDVGTEYALKHSSDTDLYSCPSNDVVCAERNISFEIGQKVLLKNENLFGVNGRQSRIQEYEKSINQTFNATYIVGDNSKYSRLSNIERGIVDVEVAERDAVLVGTNQKITGKKVFTTPQVFEGGIMSKHVKTQRLYIPSINTDGSVDIDKYYVSVNNNGAVSATPPTAGSGSNVVWEDNNEDYSVLNVNGTPKTVALEGHKHTTDDITDLESWISEKGYLTSVTKADIGLGKVENKSASDILAELTKSDITTLLGSDTYDDKGAANVALSAAKKYLDDKIGVADGLATLGSDGLIPSSQLPSYVDDVLEYTSLSVFPAVGESGKIYVDLSDNKTYRWSGSTYVEISKSLVYFNGSFINIGSDYKINLVVDSQGGLGDPNNNGLGIKHNGVVTSMLDDGAVTNDKLSDNVNNTLTSHSDSISSLIDSIESLSASSSFIQALVDTNAKDIHTLETIISDLYGNEITKGIIEVNGLKIDRYEIKIDTTSAVDGEEPGVGSLFDEAQMWDILTDGAGNEIIAASHLPHFVTLFGGQHGDISVGAGLAMDAATATVKLSASGATAGSYGPSANVTGNDGNTISIPQIEVDTYGRITGISNKTYTSKNNTYTFNGAVSTIKDSNLTTSRVLISNSNGKVAVSAITSTELGYLDGATSNIQDQFDSIMAIPDSISLIQALADTNAKDIHTLEVDLWDEIDNRLASESILQGNIDSEATARAAADNTLQSNINTEVQARKDAVSNEATLRNNADTILQNNIDSEASARSGSDNTITKVLSEAIAVIKGMVHTNSTNIKGLETQFADLFGECVTKGIIEVNGLKIGEYEIKIDTTDAVPV